eukprot:TRINITY_DN5238_c0_g3_i3.p1 TRINITY_DN5238_c0_g3~~TRINITY_DN5238_c0_g3_i3.p1  ORF type:complete len:209 (-),score=5.31 TRINITY_DN5238_c0_g3_i3:243-869(-)
MEDTQETKVDIVESVVHPTLEFIEPSLAHIEDEKNVSQLPLPSILDPNKPLSSNSFAWIFDVKEEEESNASLLEELDINPNEIFYKIRCILFPFYLPSSPTDDNVALLRTPDFWGPLLTVLVYCFILFIQHPSSFSWILSIWLFGSFILFLFKSCAWRRVLLFCNTRISWIFVDTINYRRISRYGHSFLFPGPSFQVDWMYMGCVWCL